MSRLSLVAAAIALAACGETVGDLFHPRGASVPTNGCSELLALSMPPVIDGVVEAGLALTPIEQPYWNSSVVPVMPPGNVAAYAAAWWPDGIYIFMSIDDPERLPAESGDFTYCGDSAEIYLDADADYALAGAYDDPGTRQFIVAAPAEDLAPEQRAQSFVEEVLQTWTSSQVGSFPRAGGYSVEAAITAPDLGLESWTLSTGGRVGFDLGINVSATTPGGGGGLTTCTVAHRVGQYFVNVLPTGPCRFPYCGTGAFCAPVLGR